MSKFILAGGDIKTVFCAERQQRGVMRVATTVAADIRKITGQERPNNTRVALTSDPYTGASANADVIIVAGVIDIIIQGMNIGIEFSAGATIEVTVNDFADPDVDFFDHGQFQRLHHDGLLVADHLAVAGDDHIDFAERRPQQRSGDEQKGEEHTVTRPEGQPGIGDLQSVGLKFDRRLRNFLFFA